jgi:hypothetical protein
MQPICNDLTFDEFDESLCGWPYEEDVMGISSLFRDEAEEV